MARRILLIIVILLLLLLFVAVPSVSWAQEKAGDGLAAAAHRLVERIATAGGSHSVILTVRSDPQLSAALRRRAETALEAALTARGIRREGQSAVGLTVGLWKSAQGLLWVAELHGDSGNEVLMESVGPTEDVLSEFSQALALHAELVWQQTEVMLDICIEPREADRPRVVVLEPERLVSHTPQADGHSAFPVALPAPRDSLRDPWGRVIRREDGYLFTAMGNQGKIVISDHAQIVLVGVATPEFLERGRVRWQQGDRMLEARAVEFGGVRVSDVGTGLLGEFADWGSEFAAVESGCAAGAQLLVTGMRDWTEEDSIRAVEFDGRNPVNVSAPLALPGPVLALHVRGNSRGATAIVRNAGSGKYEAYAISVSCSR
jgi:hypothetical protein